MAAAGTTYEAVGERYDYEFRCIHCGVVLEPETAHESEPRAMEGVT